MDERHDNRRGRLREADITPEDAHYFTEVWDDEDTCEICGKAVDDTLHKQAALAGYYLNKDDVDKQIAETQEYWSTKGDGPAGGRRSPLPAMTSAWTGSRSRPTTSSSGRCGRGRPGHVVLGAARAPRTTTR